MSEILSFWSFCVERVGFVQHPYNLILYGIHAIAIPLEGSFWVSSMVGLGPEAFSLSLSC